MGYDQMNLGLLLFIPYRHIENAALDAVRAHGHEVPISQARVFQRIAPRGSRMSELAEAAQVSKQTLTSIVDQLEKAGYVRRTPDPSDARARLVQITELGHQLVAWGASAVAEVEAQWEAHLGKARARQLRELLAELCAITDPFGAD